MRFDVDCGSGVHLAVTRSGTGPVLLVLHGFTGSATSMAPLTERLTARRTILAVDLIGHGHSSSPSDPSLYSMGAAVGQLCRVLDACGGGAVDVVGYSMGGRIALSLACAEPGRVASVTVIGGRAGFADPAERRARIVADEKLADDILTLGMEQFVDRWMAQPLFATQSRLGVAALAAARARRLGNSPIGLANSLRGMGSGAMPPLHDELRHCHVPANIVVGADDVRFEPIAAELVDMLPVAKLVTIPGAGHAAHLEQPALVAALF